jgi:hypothetical protein
MTIQRDISTGLAAGSTGVAYLKYNGTTPAAGTFNGSATDPTGTTRLNYSGNFHATNLYGNGAGLTGIQPFASGTKLVFAQAAAPTGWTQIVDTSADNRMLRIVTTAGGGYAGTHSPILNNVVPAHTHSFTSGNESAEHTHSGTTGGISANHTHVFGSAGGYTDQGYDGLNQVRISLNAGVTGANSVGHTHSFTTGAVSANHTHSGTTDNGSSQTNWAPKYIDLILCSKN